jgi:DNA polymerase
VPENQELLFDLGDGEARFPTLEALNADMKQRAEALGPLSGGIMIPGYGATNPPLAIVGESPGPPDIRTGKPFTGPAGDMLDRMLAAIDLSRNECYMTNAVKIISTGAEITAEVLSFFAPYLRDEMILVKPKVILAMGNTPAHTLLHTKKPISQLRGQVFTYESAQLVPTFNPAYLLRDPTKKREAWEDLKKVRSLLD